MGRLFAGTPWDRPTSCEVCGLIESECNCLPPPAKRVAPELQTARVKLEKRKKGKYVTIVSGLSVTGNDLPSLLTEMKSQCGAGGTLKEGLLELQGDHRQRVIKLLAEKGYRVE